MDHVRTIAQAAQYFKEKDPDTSLTESAIRRLVRSGTVSSAMAGKKYLVTIEALEAYLRTPTVDLPTKIAGKWRI